MASLKGVGPDAPVVCNDRGGLQSATSYRFDLLPPLAVAGVSEVLAHGAEKYAAWNWLQINPHDHLNHALQHIFAFIAGDKQEGSEMAHAEHAACRILMWLDTLKRQEAP